MARIELRYCTIILQDGLGLAGADGVTMPTAKVATTAATAAATSLTLNDVVIPRAKNTAKVPLGARFTLASEAGELIHIVTARTQSSEDVTTAITFSPPLAAAATTYAIGDVLTILSQQLEIKIGEGNCTYDEKKEYKYDLERGNLDAVREGNEVPVEMKFECVYEHITTGTSEPLCPMDALKGQGAGSRMGHVRSRSVRAPCRGSDHHVHAAVLRCGHRDHVLPRLPCRLEGHRLQQGDDLRGNGKCNVTEAVVSRVPQA